MAIEPPIPDRRNPRGKAFTLIEVLVVVAIIALLITILIPSLTKARAQARLATCGSNLHQLGVGIVAYAHSAQVIPHGPNVQGLGSMLEPNNGRLATNQIWTGPQAPATSTMALGLLLGSRGAPPEVLYCPGDNSSDPREELAKIRAHEYVPAFGSYLYRQLDETTGQGHLDSLGRNGAGRRAVALALDMNSIITVDPSYARTNHDARRVNLLFVDGSVRSLSDDGSRFALRDQDLMDLAARRDEILRNADRQY